MEENEKNELAEKVNSYNVPMDENKTITENVINAQKQSAMTIKEAIDLDATKVALEQKPTVQMIVDTKGQELFQDAQSKLAEAETKRILQEKQKELAYYNKENEALRKQTEQLKAESDKAEQFFENHKSILKCVGVREKLGLKAMQWWMVPASIIYGIFQVLLLPITICGFAVEQIINILGAICEKISQKGVKIVLSILVILFIIAVAVGSYWLIVKYIK